MNKINPHCLKRLPILLLICSLAITITGRIFAQTQQTATIFNLGSNSVVVDGIADVVWAEVEPIEITRNFTGETPSVDVAWKMLWNTDGVYIIIEALDDVWNPVWLSGIESWASDYVELYFDVSNPQQDGGGPGNSDQTAAGNHQVAPEFLQTSGKLKTEFNGVLSATVFDGAGVYNKEFWVPFSAIPQSGTVINPEVMNVIGFDVSIADNDNDGYGRQRKVWSNDGTVNEDWNNCDGAGLITFSSTEVVAVGFPVTFNVDMNAPINEGKFIEGTDELWMAGSMSGGWNTWNKPGIDPKMKMHESSTNNIYTITLTVSNGQYAYKFFKNATWDFGEPITSDRIVDITASTQIDCIWGVKVTLKPNTNFEVDNTSTAVNTIINFTDLSENYPTSWLWDFGDGKTSTFQHPTHVYTAPGTYTVSLQSTNNVGSSTEVKQNYITVSAVGVNNTESIKQVKVYPNPSKGKINLSIDKSVSENLEVQIMDETGRVVFAKHYDTKQNIEIDLSSKPKGIYIMQIVGENFIETEKLIID